MKNNTMIITILLVVVGISAGFFGGMKYSDYQRAQMRNNGNRQFQGGANGQIPGRTQGGGRPITGEIISKDDKSITVKTEGQGSKIIMLSNTTTYSKTAEVTLEDIAIGDKVGVFGTENSDKSMTAQNIQLNPQFRIGSTPTPSK
jgi:hypothetical protein